jgi:hypothetical protein
MAVLAAAALLVFCYGFWFGFTLYKRSRAAAHPQDHVELIHALSR